MNWTEGAVMDRNLTTVPSAAPHTAATERAMTAAEAERLRQLEIGMAAHVKWCESREVVMDLRFLAARSENLAALDRQNSMRLISNIALAVIVILVGIKQPAALFELLAKL